MATFTKSNSDNFLTWQKVNGVIPLSELQSRGIPACKEGYNIKDLTWIHSINSGGGSNTTFSVFWSDDGLDCYYVVPGSSVIRQKSVSFPFDITTITASQDKDISAQDTTPKEVRFNGDGSKMLFLGTENDSIYQYTLTTPWDISTAGYDSKALDYSSQAAGGTGFHFSSTNVYIAIGSTIYQYSWTTDDLSTAVYLRNKLFGGLTLYSLFYRNDQKLYVTDTAGADVYEISMGEGSLANALITQVSTVTLPDDPVGIFFDNGGFTLWVMTNDDHLNKYWVGCP